MSEGNSGNFTLQTAPFDSRFANTNQTKACFQYFTDYVKCVAAEGEEFKGCKQFKRNYTSMCPVSWVSAWDEMREEGKFPASLEP